MEYASSILLAWCDWVFLVQTNPLVLLIKRWQWLPLWIIVMENPDTNGIRACGVQLDIKKLPSEDALESEIGDGFMCLMKMGDVWE